jgi:hypothetical protein
MEGLPIVLTAGQHLKALTLTTYRRSPSRDRLVSAEVKQPPSPLTLEGEVLVDGKTPKGEGLKFVPVLFERSVRLEWLDGKEGVKGQLDVDGKFSLKNLKLEDYSFGQEDFQSSYYVKSLTLDGKLLDGMRILLHPRRTAHLIVQLAADGASGTLAVGPNPLPNDPYVDQCQNLGGVPILLMIPDPLPADNSGILARYSSSNGDGNPTGEAGFTAVPPGRYHILALELMERKSGGILISADEVLPTSHDALVKLAALGKPVEVGSMRRFAWVAPLLTEQMFRLKAELGLLATH